MRGTWAQEAGRESGAGGGVRRREEGWMKAARGEASERTESKGMSAASHPRSVELGLPLLLSRVPSLFTLLVCVSWPQGGMVGRGGSGSGSECNVYATYSMASFFMLESTYIGCSYRGFWLFSTAFVFGDFNHH